MRALDRPRYRIDNAGHLLTERKKVNQSADAAGGWIEGGGGVRAIVLARIKVVKNFFKPSKSRSGRSLNLLLFRVETQ